MGLLLTVMWLIADLRRPNDDDIDDDVDIFADLLSDSDEEGEKDKQMKPKLKLITKSSNTQSINTNATDHGKYINIIMKHDHGCSYNDTSVIVRSYSEHIYVHIPYKNF